MVRILIGVASHWCIQAVTMVTSTTVLLCNVCECTSCVLAPLTPLLCHRVERRVVSMLTLSEYTYIHTYIQYQQVYKCTYIVYKETILYYQVYKCVHTYMYIIL